jgi:DNA-binding XRE family transcriptional regulator
MSNRLREYLHKNCITQRGFAKKIGVSTATLYSLINDEQLPNLLDADAIQKATRGYVTFEHWVKNKDAVKNKKETKQKPCNEQIAKSPKLAIS